MKTSTSPLNLTTKSYLAHQFGVFFINYFLALILCEQVTKMSKINNAMGVLIKAITL